MLSRASRACLRHGARGMRGVPVRPSGKEPASRMAAGGNRMGVGDIQGGGLRHRAQIGIAVVVLAVLACTQLYASKKAEDSTLPRDLRGTVFDRADHAVRGAVVYLENQHTLAVFTYITGDDGFYRFNNLSPDFDYKVYATSGGQKSATRTLSSFDTRKQVRINLKLGK
jgi:hypothetical protein